jgi:predicted nucleotidyltransferase|tara:strand:- start:221 stop:508 length:288 start_codon:yes stop_codon:yes gene_type:complete
VRLTLTEQQVIRDSIHRVDPKARIVLFGSRVDDQARGGDIDLLVLSNRIGFDDLWPMRRDILDRIGWQKLDLIVENEDQGLSPIARVAMETGKRL